MNQTIREIIQNFSLNDYRPIFKRELDLGKPFVPRAGNMVVVVTGMRRSGKSYRLFQVMDELLKAGVPKERMLYFNFEDDRLEPVTTRTGDDVLEEFYSLHPQAASEGSYLFFDELQEMDNWGQWLRRIVDTTKATIYVSGSSSKLLSSELASEMRGRSIEYVLYPYSFREYVGVHYPRIDVDAPAFSTIERITLQNAFDAYLREGGFPGVQDLSASQAVSTLQGYAQRVVARDVIERHNVSNPRAVVGFARKLMALNGRLLSLRKAENELKSGGVTVSRAALGDYLSYFEEAFLVLPVRERTRSAASASSSMMKAYAVDPGLSRANAPASVRDEGQSLEDAVCVELHRRMGVMRDNAVSFGKTQRHGYEIDFIAGDALFASDLFLCQVTMSLDDEKTLDRETRALWEALEEWDLAEGIIIVGSGEDRAYEREGHTIHCVPAWRWFLQG